MLGATLSREVIVPFVYRRNVDPGIATSLAELMQRTRTELKADLLVMGCRAFGPVKR